MNINRVLDLVLENPYSPIFAARVVAPKELDSKTLTTYNGLANYMDSEASKDVTDHFDLCDVEKKLNSLWNKIYSKAFFPKGKRCICCQGYFPDTTEMVPCKDYNSTEKKFYEGFLCPRCNRASLLFEHEHCDFCDCDICSTDTVNYKEYLNFPTDAIGKKKRNGAVSTYDFTRKIYQLPVFQANIYWRAKWRYSELYNMGKDCEDNGTVFKSWKQISEATYLLENLSELDNPNFSKVLSRCGFTPDIIEFIKKNKGKNICLECADKMGLNLRTTHFENDDLREYQATMRIPRSGGDGKTRNARIHDLFAILKSDVNKISNTNNTSSSTSKYTPGVYAGRPLFGLPNPAAYVYGKTQESNLAHHQLEEGLMASFLVFSKELYAKILPNSSKMFKKAKKYVLEDLNFSYEKGSSIFNLKVGMAFMDTHPDEDKTQEIANCITKDFTNKFTCFWTESPVFLYAAFTFYVDPVWENCTNEDQIQQGFWSCEIDSSVDNLKVEREDDFYSVNFDYNINLDIMEGNPKNARPLRLYTWHFQNIKSAW